MATDDFLSKLIAGVGDAIDPLISSLKSKEEFASFLSNLGWVWDQNGDINSIQSAFNNVDHAMTALRNAVNSNDTASLTTAAIDLTSAIAALSGTNFNALPSPLNQSAFWNTFPDDVLEFLIYQYFNQHQPFLFGTLVFAGVLKKEPKEADVVTGRQTYDRMGVDWGSIPQGIAAPQDILKNVYGWGQNFKHKEFMLNLGSMLAGLNAGAKIYSANERLLDLYYDSDNASRLDTQMLVASLFQLDSLTDDLEKIIKAVLVAMPVPPKGDRLGAPEGIMFFPRIIGSAGLTITLQPGVDLMLSGGFDVEIIRASVRPSGLDIELPPLDAAYLNTKAGVYINLMPPRVIIGGAQSTRLEFSEAHVSLALSGPVTDLEYVIEAAIDNMNLILDFSQSDNFLKMIFGSKSQAVALNYGMAWSSKSGLRFLGEPGLEIEMPIHLNLMDVISIDTIYLSAHADLQKKSTQMIIALTAGFNLGPISASVQKIGMKMDVGTADKEHPGNLGTLNLTLGFKPPNGVGLSIDAEVIKGGGFLYLDADKGEYMGALELDFQNMFSLKAIGIITTKLPDGSRGYSLLIIITAEFNPVQLGFGFTLNGVGGLLGLNRTTRIEILKEGIKTNALKSILFPEDVVANINRIVSDLKQIFPIQADRFIIGPMAKIGWGTPSIITLELGLLIEIPVPRIAILGVLKAILPKEEEAVLALQVNFLGVIDFDNKYISFDASLYDSRLMVYTLTGDMAFRLSWGDNPLFIMSVGGFHPSFKDAPADLQRMTRLTISLLSGENARISLQSYFAVTSNTVQFGAKAELYAAAAGFNVYGFIGFDVLLQYPFRFMADIYAGLALRRGSSVLMGIRLAGALTGPTPWEGRGEASISVLFFDVTVSFHETWGDRAAEIEPEKVDVLALLTAEVNDNRNWKAEIPDNNNLHVSIKLIELSKDVPKKIEISRFENDILNKVIEADRQYLMGQYDKDTSLNSYVLKEPLNENDKTKVVEILNSVQYYNLVIHPFGVLTFSERFVPLNIAINKFGSKVPKDANKFELTEIKSGATNLATQVVKEQFARANFIEMSDNEKLSHPSFDLMPSGFNITASADLKIANPVSKSVDYELTYMRKKQFTMLFAGMYKFAKRFFKMATKGNAATKSTLSYQNNRISNNAPEIVAIKPEQYVIANVSDMQLHSPEMVADSYTEASQLYQELIIKKPELKNNIQILSHYELARN